MADGAVFHPGCDYAQHTIGPGGPQNINNVGVSTKHVHDYELSNAVLKLRVSVVVLDSHTEEGLTLITVVALSFLYILRTLIATGVSRSRP